MKKTMTLNDITLDTLRDALFAYGAEPCLLETQEYIEYTKSLLDDAADRLIEVLPGEDDFEFICESLDLTVDDADRVYIIDFGYNQERGYIAFRDDWRY